MSQPNVLVAYCSGDLVHADFTARLVGLMLVTDQQGVSTALANPKSSCVAHGRCAAAAAALQMNASHLFFLDSDMTFPADALLRLLGRRADIVGATYRKRAAPFTLNHQELGGKPGTLEPGDKGLRAVDRLPTGCLLISTTVLRRLTKPYFKFGYTPGVEGIIGEDFLFCDEARQLGYSVYLDCDLSRTIGHIGQQEYTI